MKRPDDMSYEEYREWREKQQEKYKRKASEGKIIPSTRISSNSSSRTQRRKMKRDVEKAGGLKNYLAMMTDPVDKGEEEVDEDVPTVGEMIAEGDSEVFSEEE